MISDWSKNRVLDVKLLGVSLLFPACKLQPEAKLQVFKYILQNQDVFTCERIHSNLLLISIHPFVHCLIVWGGSYDSVLKLIWLLAAYEIMPLIIIIKILLDDFKILKTCRTIHLKITEGIPIHKHRLCLNSQDSSVPLHILG